MRRGTQPGKKVDSQFPASSPPPPAPSPSLPGGLRESFWAARKSAPRWESDGNSAASVPPEQGAARAPRLPAVPCRRRAAGRSRSWGQRDALPLARAPGPRAPRRRQKRAGQILPRLSPAGKAHARSGSQIPVCKQRCAGRATSASSSPLVLGKAAALREEGKAGGKGCCPNGCGALAGSWGGGAGHCSPHRFRWGRKGRPWPSGRLGPCQVRPRRCCRQERLHIPM